MTHIFVNFPDACWTSVKIGNWDQFCEVFYWVKLCVNFEKSAPQEKWYFEFMAIEVYANLAAYVKLYLDDNSLKWNTFTLLIYIWDSVLKLWDCLTQKPGLRDINLNDFA
ncbi:uncharacterized protein CIMG_13438 [Coccidioides immitis RS]|uniref:Uncharacterized protein n=1 Tax=Coccidioides immitis (strain RS) TaxID=246410 RepID=A0A0D8JVI7_COCIM|nr:uncharacterized protein CIMG_13438 [Coccidioides immitis RS]KJF61119.1 hypothetical protein CIMG_13438 [Coccidioides immitis RS]